MLHQASADGNFELVVQLVKENKRLVNVKDGKGWSPVLLAASQGHWRITRFLLRNGANRDDLVLASGGSGSSLLMYLCSHRVPDDVTSDEDRTLYGKLLNSLADQVKSINNLGENVFHRLAQHNNSLAFRLLLPGARRSLSTRALIDQLNRANNRRWPPVAVAVAAGSMEVLAALLECGVDANVLVRLSDDRKVAAVAAATSNCATSKNFPDVVTLIQLTHVLGGTMAGIRAILSTQREAERRALALARVGQRGEFLRLLQRRPSIVFADDSLVHLPDNPASAVLKPSGEGLTPLHCFCMASDHMTLRRILPLCSSELINRPDLRGWTPLVHACFCGDLRCVDLLLAAGAAAAPEPRITQVLLFQRSRSQKVLAAASASSSSPRSSLRRSGSTQNRQPSQQLSVSDRFETPYMSLAALSLANEAARRGLSVSSSSSPVSARRQQLLGGLCSSADADDSDLMDSGYRRFGIPKKYMGPSGERDPDDDDDLDESEGDTLSILSALAQARADGWHAGESINLESDSLSSLSRRSTMSESSISSTVNTTSPNSITTTTTTSTTTITTNTTTTNSTITTITTTNTTNTTNNTTVTNNTNSNVTDGDSVGDAQSIHFGRHLPAPFALIHFVKRVPAKKDEKMYLALLHRLIDSGADPSLSTKFGSTALHEACFRNNLVAVKFLLGQDKMDVNATTIQGETPLFMAARRGSAALVQLLLDAGANPLFDAEAPSRPGRSRPRSSEMPAVRPIESQLTRQVSMSTSSLHPPAAAAAAVAVQQRPRSRLPVSVAVNDETRRLLLAPGRLSLVHLPHELLLAIFAFFASSRDDFVTLERTCKTFYELVHDYGGLEQAGVAQGFEFNFRRAVLDLMALHLESRDWIRLPPPSHESSSVEEPDYYFKIALVGLKGVGKSSLLQRLVDDQFIQQNRSSGKMTRATIDCCLAGAEASATAASSWKQVQTPAIASVTSAAAAADAAAMASRMGSLSVRERVNVQVFCFDLDDRKGEETNIKQLFRGAQAVFFCFAIHDQASFDALDLSQFPECSVRYLIGLQSDRTERSVELSTVEQSCAQAQCAYFETSALRDSAVVSTFVAAIDRVHLTLTGGTAVVSATTSGGAGSLFQPHKFASLFNLKRFFKSK